MTASSHRRLAGLVAPARSRTGQQIRIVLKVLAPHANARFCRGETDTERRTRCSASPSNDRSSARITK